jgi:hypothetical protein
MVELKNWAALDGLNEKFEANQQKSWEVTMPSASWRPSA